MDILTQDQSRAIVRIAVDELGFLKDEIWGPGWLGVFLEDPNYYKPGSEGYASPLRYFSYPDRDLKLTLVAVRPDGYSPVNRVVVLRAEDSPVSKETVDAANAKLKELFQ